MPHANLEVERAIWGMCYAWGKPLPLDKIMAVQV